QKTSCTIRHTGSFFQNHSVFLKLEFTFSIYVIP
ncbi:hypothetical protein M2475_001864, partial [Breznakia sp. PF5-3]|nr:hypothetical protein [Breznakia sp. PM6-1]MDF9836287.1 hypothetical protein [Breznakia sp. PF5-3]